MAQDQVSGEVTQLHAELAAVEAEFGLTVTSVFPGTDPAATQADVLREVTASLRRVGEELKTGTLEIVELDD